MRKLVRVIEVFIPNDEPLTKIGFKIEIEGKIITLIEKQNIDNAKIYRDDFIYIEVTNINNEIKYSIIPLNDIDSGDEEYE